MEGWIIVPVAAPSVRLGEEVEVVRMSDFVEVWVIVPLAILDDELDTRDDVEGTDVLVVSDC